MSHRTQPASRPSLLTCAALTLLALACVAVLLTLHTWASDRASQRAERSDSVAALLDSPYSAPRTAPAADTYAAQWAPGSGSSAAPVIEEDSPLWDCATMGNRICGPGAVPLSPASDYAQRPLSAQLADPARCSITGSILAPVFSCDAAHS